MASPRGGPCEPRSLRLKSEESSLVPRNGVELSGKELLIRTPIESSVLEDSIGVGIHLSWARCPEGTEGGAGVAYQNQLMNEFHRTGTAAP